MAQTFLRPELALVRRYQAEEQPAKILLDAKENPYPLPAPFMRKAAAALAKSSLNRYPDPSAAGLKRAASRHYGVPASRIVVGNGSDELLAMLCQACGGRKAACLIPAPTFGMYRLCAKVQGMRVVEEPLGPDGEITEAFLRLAERLKPALVFLAFPNSPTGNFFDPAAIRRLLRLKGTLVVVDEAYAEFSGVTFRREIGRHANLAVVSTLSKAWGLAGLRTGFLFAQEPLVRELEKLRLPYNLDSLSLALAELALSSSRDFAPRWKAVWATRQRMERELAALPGIRVYPSQANFVMVRHPRARGLNAALLKAGIRVRTLFANPGMGDALQITAGTDAEVDKMLSTARAFLGGRDTRRGKA